PAAIRRFLTSLRNVRLAAGKRVPYSLPHSRTTETTMKSAFLRRALAAGLVAACGAALPAAAAQAAQDYPDRAVRLIVPYAAGGPTDTFARALAESWGRQLGVPLIIENRTGAGTVVGTEAVAKAPPDGYTLLLTTVAHAVNPSIHEKLPYRAVEDFAPVGLAAKAPLVLIVNKNVPAQTLPEFLSYLKANPG